MYVSHSSTTLEIIYQHLRFDELNRMPRNLRPDEAREIVQLARLIGSRSEPPIIDDDPHGGEPPPENPIYSRGAR